MNNKILFISTSISKKLLNYGISGGEIRLSEIMKGSVRNNIDTHFLVNNGGDIFCKDFSIENIKIHSLNFKTSIKRMGAIFLVIKIIFFKLPNTLKNFDNGIVYSANELLFDVIPALKMKLFRKNIKWAAVVHWVPPLKFWRRKKSKFFNSLFFLIGERFSVILIKYFADFVFPVSESTANQLNQFKINKTKIFPVKCGVNLKDIEKIYLQINKEKIYDAVFMKRIQSVKGVFDLVDIWEKVVRLKKDAKLAVIGGGAENEAHVKYGSFLKMVKSKNLENNILLLGFIKDLQRKVEILSKSKMFILPSYEENWAIVIGEAMACRLPVVAYKLKELDMVWKDSYIKIELGNIENFSGEILNLLKNKEKIEKFSNIGFNYVKELDWEEISNNEMNIIINNNNSDKV